MIKTPLIAEEVGSLLLYFFVSKSLSASSTSFWSPVTSFAIHQYESTPLWRLQCSGQGVGLDIDHVKWPGVRYPRKTRLAVCAGKGQFARFFSSCRRRTLNSEVPLVEKARVVLVSENVLSKQANVSSLCYMLRCYRPGKWIDNMNILGSGAIQMFAFIYL